MIRQPLRIGTTQQLAPSVRAAGFEAFVAPESISADFHRSIEQRKTEGPIMREFIERNRIDLLLDFNTQLMTFVRVQGDSGPFALTNAVMKIPYVACYLDPITSTMQQVPWQDHWQILESPDWIKWIWETAHSEELLRMGVPNIVTMPMAAADADYDVTPPPEVPGGPAVAFMGHPASSWFSTKQELHSGQLFAGFTAAAVNADMPHLPFHKIYYDLYQFAAPPAVGAEQLARAQRAAEYYNQKFAYNAYLAVKQRDRFATFLKKRLGDAFELIGDHWESLYGLKHTPRIWDMDVLHRRMREVPICLNLIKGASETGLIVRHYEITSNGGFMLTYDMPELANQFEAGVECEVFHNEAELLDKIAFYLANPKKRLEIAAAGQKKTLSCHLYSHRIVNLVELLRQAGKLPRPAGVEEKAIGTVRSELVEAM